jgi:hypothetical protein
MAPATETPVEPSQRNRSSPFRHAQTISDIRGPCLAALGACLTACAAGAAAERQEHIVVPPRTSEVSQGLGPDLSPAFAEGACPMRVDGTDVLLIPIKGGSAFVFTTSLESPVEVRRRAWYFASLYDTHASTAADLQRPGRSPAGFPTMAQYSEVTAGARVEIRPLFSKDVEALRVHLRRSLQHMRATKSC